MNTTLFHLGRYDIVLDWGAMLHDMRADFEWLSGFWYTLTTLFIWCAVTMIAALAIYTIVSSSVSIWREHRARGASYSSLFVFIIGAIATVYCAATKPKPTPSAALRFDRGLHDNGSVATNDHPVIRGTVDALYTLDALHIDYRPKYSTNALDYVRAYDGRTTDLIAGISVFIPDCTDKLIWIWSEYIEPPPEHTNGEYRLDYVTRPLDGPVDPESPEFIMLRTPLIDSETGRKMSPPELPQPIEFTDEEIRRLLNDNNQEYNK